jgi:hypothetical protein|tara:strand:- start:4794 stop:4952 length:159 start_codon:yes stop_codon:yes gene_type:complete
MTELLLTFALGLALGIIISALFTFICMFFHHYKRIISDKEEIYGTEKNGEES